MELRHLRYFVAVAEAGSFVKAARKLHLAQPALSRQVQSLERELGVPLLERLPHGTRLTSAGRAFFVDAKRLLAGVERAALRVRNPAAIDSASVMIGYGELLAHWRTISNVLHDFRVAHPEAHLDATSMTWRDITDSLRTERIDVGIIGVVHWPVRGFDGVRLIDASQTGVLIAAHHPLARKPRIRLAELGDTPWCHLSRDATWGAYDLLKRVLRERGFKGPEQHSRPASFAFLPQIAAGDGWSFADSAIAQVVDGVTDGIVYRPFDDSPIQLWAAALWKKGNASDSLRDFIAVARRVCGVGADGEPPAARSA